MLWLHYSYGNFKRGWDYLKKLRFSWQSPRPKHRKGNKIDQDEFIKNLPIKVKKIEQAHPNSEIKIWFFDEHRVGLKPILRSDAARSWGFPHSLLHQDKVWSRVRRKTNCDCSTSLSMVVCLWICPTEDRKNFMVFNTQ
ncbi:winged helix-turn-helix domain-containing protein, partial [Moorena sp. SIO4A1]|uniref:winged helix-turn-helix domain-containing protein n=1 Tax=Moorena sp. SIO4A1 TaxID=2607835 RepID=UPI003450ACF6